MTNEELLADLKVRLESGELSREVVTNLLADSYQPGSPKPGREQAAPSTSIQPSGSVFSSFTVTRLLYVVGAIFITLGVLYLVSQIWNDLGSFGRIGITFGLGLVFAAMGSFLMQSLPDRDLGKVLHGIGGLLIPGGALVTLDELSTGSDAIWAVTLTIGAVFAFYLTLVWYHRHVILNFFAFANGTAFIYLLMEAVLPFTSGDHYAYLTMAIGVSYLLFAWELQSGWNDRLIPFLLFFGSFGFYLAAFSRMYDSIVMEFLFPFLAFGGLVMAVLYLRSRIVLIISTLAVISYIIYYTAEYFADSIGWPIALILLGFIIMGIGYVSISLNKKFLK